MPFFQNVFAADFEGYWLLADRQASLTFRCPHNAGRGSESVLAWATAPYDLSGNDASGNSKAVLTLSFAIGGRFADWADVSVTISAASLAVTTAAEVVGSLNNDATFADWFEASVTNADKGTPTVMIKQKLPQTRMRFYVKNGRAEVGLLFNKLAGVAPLPAYFARHTLANRYQFPDSQNMLIQLGTTGVDANVIDNAVDHRGVSLGYSHLAVPADYTLLAGRSGLFMITKNTLDGSNRVTTSILYQAGAVAGDMAKKIEYTYSGVATTPSTIAEIPYVLTSGDLVTPS